MSLAPSADRAGPRGDGPRRPGRLSARQHLHGPARRVGDDLQRRGIRRPLPTRGRPAEAPWRLALVTVLQFVEGLSDRRAAEAVRGRIDWKYALGLPARRSRLRRLGPLRVPRALIDAGSEGRLLDALLESVSLAGLAEGPRPPAHRLDARPGPRPRHRPAGVRRRDAAPRPEQPGGRRPRDGSRARRPAGVGRALRAASRGLPAPDSEGGRASVARQVGEDGHAARWRWPTAPAPHWLGQIPAVETLRRVWVQQFVVEDGRVRWRTEEDGIPPAAIFHQLAARRRGAVRQEAIDESGSATRCT